MTQYLFSVIHDQPADEYRASLTDDEYASIDAAVGAVNQRAMDAGVWVFAGGLMPVTQATTVDNTGEAVVVTDGPYVESKEHIGGFWIFELPDLDVALSWAEEASAACRVPIEVRAFQGEA